MGETLSLGAGVFLFTMLGVGWMGCLALIIGGLFTIEEKSGWDVVWITLGIIALSILMGVAIYVGGDQIANGYHMYG